MDKALTLGCVAFVTVVTLPLAAVETGWWWLFGRKIKHVQDDLDLYFTEQLALLNASSVFESEVA